MSHVTALVFRSKSIESFHIHVPLPIGDDSAILEPSDTFEWQYRIHNMNAEISPTLHPNSSTYYPINLLIRFGSGFPWPVNMLHRFTIHPNLEYSPQLSAHGPYKISPRLRQTQGSPVRLFADAPQALGRYGTSMWVDTHTEEYFDGDGQGQRLAGRILLHSCTNVEEDHPETAPGESTGESVYRTRWDGSWKRIAIDERMGMIALGSSDGRLDILFIAS
jgi:hypothetical protein